MDSAIPPSYEEATTRNHWSLVANYIESADLCSASLVSKAWHDIFAPCLWGNPASHFGTENDRVYVALTRFKRTLPLARIQVRQLTHTLHLPPALSEIYDGPRPEWLRDVLDQLPNLQSLVVSQLPFFDHAALLSLRQYGTTHAEASREDPPVFPLRLLIASQCMNTTSLGLAEAFLHFPGLVFLDLSDTIAARDETVLSRLRYMPTLQVLKLRHIQLRDEDVGTLADAIKIRVRSLDIRDNRVTDDSVRTLLSKCFHKTKNVHASHDRLGWLKRDEGDWPSGLSRPDSRLLHQFRDNDMDQRFVRRLSKSLVGRIASEDLPATGLTHLYIANNYITMEGLASLVRTQNLHVLDAGDLHTAKALGRSRSGSSMTKPMNIMLPGAEKLAPVLERHSAQNMTYLRLHHALVTEATIAKSAIPSPIELHSEQAQPPEIDGERISREELGGDSLFPQELDQAAPAYEVSADPPTPKHELPGDPLHIFVSQATTGPTKSDLEESTTSQVSRGPAFAPEVVGDEAEEPTVLTSTGLSLEAQAINGISTGDIEGRLEGVAGIRSLSPMSSNASEDDPESTESRILRLDGQRQHLRHGVRDPSRGLLPGHLPALRVLVLTEVPSYATSASTVDNLKSFISDCAREHYLASAQAALEHPDTYLPRKTISTVKSDRSRELFSLKRIELEIAPLSSAAASTVEGQLSPRTPPSNGWGFKQRYRSSTEDADTEAFWSAQENDFSFFGDEECGLPASEPGMHFPLSSLSEKMVLPTESLHPAAALPTLQQPQDQRSSQGGSQGTIIDVVGELAQWRGERKRAFEEAGKRGGFVEGYWPGEVKVVRVGRGKGRKRGGTVDWYGNYFEKGIYR